MDAAYLTAGAVNQTQSQIVTQHTPSKNVVKVSPLSYTQQPYDTVRAY